MSYQTSWTKLLEDAVQKPGMISEAYRAFHNYSAGNQILAMVQCYERGLEPGPINTYVGWKKVGRHVNKGEKAITLCMPVTAKKKPRNRNEDSPVGYVNKSDSEGEKGEGREGEEYYKLFVYRPNWFVLSQTDGEPVMSPEIPEWDKYRCLTALDIKEVPFTMADGNALGYAREREIAISPLSPHPHKTTFHEITHVLLHTGESFQEGELTPRNLREVEAESVALLCLDSLNLSGADFARGYIQDWLQGNPIPERSSQKIFATADRILKAGQKNVSAEID